jgi:CubicO group peptidase (beta-lactamase class C family)
LNRPFIDYVPELDVPGVQWLEEARVADLLCQTSGIDDLKLRAFIDAAAGRSRAATARTRASPDLNT